MSSYWNQTIPIATLIWRSSLSWNDLPSPEDWTSIEMKCLPKEHLGYNGAWKLTPSALTSVSSLVNLTAEEFYP